MRPLVSILCLLAACAGPPRMRVLFVGNSLTEVNDVPGQVASLARAAGVPMVVDAVVLPGASLEDHWNEGTGRRRLEADRWDVVVLQQGPSSREDSRVALRRDAARWAEAARAAGARPALYMVWPIQKEPERWDDVRTSYELAARDVDGLFLPAGLAWRAALEMDPGLALYSPDGLHPTFAGSYAAALVIFARLSGRSPLDAATLGGMDERTAGVLRRAAAAVLVLAP